MSPTTTFHFAEGYLKSVKKQFSDYKALGEKTIAQMPDEALFWQYNADSNSVASIVKHLSGNMLSRWTDFLTTDGEKEWRNRDTEFENDFRSRNELLDVWEKGWNCLLNALGNLAEEDLQREIFIRGEKHTVVEAINRQLAHYPSHVGQIIFIGKMVLGEHWQSLSIARGSSAQYNAAKFAQPKD